MSSHTPVQPPASAPAQVLSKADTAASTNKLQQQKHQQHRSRRIWRILLYIWLIVVAGLPVYYFLLPDRDWNYESWGAPEEIIVSRRSQENRLHGDEQVYTRIFIARPSATNKQLFRPYANPGKREELLQSLLEEYKLPPPYRDGAWYGHGLVDVVECGNGLMLVADYSRNKGGLFSSRMSQECLWSHYPLHFIFFHSWACLGLLTLLLTPFLGIPGALLYLLVRVVRAFRT